LAVLLLAAVGVGLWLKLERDAVERDVLAALQEVEGLQREGKWAEAKAALERARGRLAGGGPRGLRRQVQQAANDLEMVTELEEIRLRHVDIKNEEFDWKGTDVAYAAAFRRYGVDVLAADPEATARRLAASAVREPLILTLDHWADAKPTTDARGRDRLLALARSTDTDQWRQKLRDPTAHRDRDALKRLANQPGAREQPPVTAILLVAALRRVGDRAEAEAVLRRAQQRHPGDFWLNFRLGMDLSYDLAPARRAEALGFLRAAVALRPQSATTHLNLGTVLHRLRRLKEAEAAYRRALALQPDDATAFSNLGATLSDQGRDKEAVAAFRKAIALKPDYPKTHNNLGALRYRQGRYKEAEAAFRRAIDLKRDYALAYESLGNALGKQGRRPEAEAAYRRATFLQPKLPVAHYGLGRSLHHQGRYKAAEAAYRRALALKPEYAEAHCNLGNVLQSQGQFAAAVVSYRRGHELGSKDPRWPYPSAQWVREAEILLGLDHKLTAILQGKARPANARDQLVFAHLCLRYKHLYAAAARLSAEAFVAEPELANDLAAGGRYRAACASALAATGQGEDAATLDATERSRLRGQALTWLQADLRAWAERVENRPAQERAAAVKRLQAWQSDPALAGVRDAAALGKLPQAEQESWQRLWVAVAALLEKASGTGTAGK
jgi:Flp pilus assembly protein TadD